MELLVSKCFETTHHHSKELSPEAKLTESLFGEHLRQHVISIYNFSSYPIKY